MSISISIRAISATSAAIIIIISYWLFKLKLPWS